MNNLQLKRRRKLVIEPGGGLGNRILALSSAVNLARDCNVNELIILWRNNNECGCNYKDIFDKLPVQCRIRNMYFEKESYKTLVLNGKIFKAIKKIMFSFLYASFRKVVGIIQINTKEQDSEQDWNRLKEEVLASRKKYLYIEAYYQFYKTNSCEGISFNKDIQEKYEEFKKKTPNYIAMHIRRTDNLTAIENSPTHLFYDEAERLIKSDKSLKIYVATDDRTVYNNIKKLYPNNIFSEAISETSRGDSKGMKFALYEMLILAGAKILYASYGSTFAQIANLIGGNEMIVLKKAG